MSIAKKGSSKDDSKEFSEGFLKFQKAMQVQSKDVSAILNCHLLAEYFIEQIIHVVIPRADILFDEGNFTFATKLTLLKSLNVVNDKTIASLRALNKVRNMCSHELGYTVTDANIDMIGRPYGKHYVETRRDNPKNLLKYTLMTPIAQLEKCYEDLIQKTKA